jgi:predicted transcriptional regulator
MTELTSSEIKATMNDWVIQKIVEHRQQGKKMSRSMLAKRLNVTESCFSQYLNPNHPKAAPWEFQIKLAEMMNQSLRKLHPELIDLSLSCSA